MSALFMIVYSVVTNLPFWSASHFFGFQGGVFCAEFAVIGIVALVAPKAYTIVLLSLALVADAVSAISQTFLLPPKECLRSVAMLGELPVQRLLLFFFVAALALLVVAIAATFPVERIPKSHRWRVALCLLGFALFIESLDYGTILRGTHQIPRLSRSGDDVVRQSFFEKPRLSRNPLLRLVRLEASGYAFSNPSQAAHADAASVSSAVNSVESATLFTPHLVAEQPNLVVILVESWGLASDSAIRDNLVLPYLGADVQSHYRVLQGTAPFYGSTIAGEARELCGSRMGFHLLEASAQELRNCLPRRLDAEGYRTIAVHGNDGLAFSRSDWYSTIGFKERWFKDRLQKEGLPVCPTSFNGICDASIASWIGDHLEPGGIDPEFVYWVTLNSHLPVPNPPQIYSPAPCSFSAFLSQSAASCSWFQLVFNVQESVHKLAMRNLSRPTVFIVVGDHAPPFADPTVRGMFSNTVVPFIALIPRDRNLGPGQLTREQQAARDRTGYRSTALSLSSDPAAEVSQKRP